MIRGPRGPWAPGRAGLIGSAIRLLREESGQSMVEYALIGAMVLVGLIAGAKLLTAAQGGVYSRHQKALGDWRSP